MDLVKVKKQKNKEVKRKLDLGCGFVLENDPNFDEVFGVDLINPNNNKNIKIADLAVEPIPFPDDYFDYIECTDFIEHIPKLIYAPKRKYSLIDLMSEISRVLKIDGELNVVVPVYPNTQAFDDPTHVNQLTIKTLTYFDITNLGKLSTVYYGYTGFLKLLNFEFSPQEQVIVRFIKLKPEPLDFRHEKIFHKYKYDKKSP